jgi:nicotinamide mononucleotide (NMN) deamidase PncC
MQLSTNQLVEEIHAATRRVVLAVAGGGSRAIGWMSDVPGASKTLLEAAVPYCPKAMTAWLGGPPDAACSVETARAMAMAAFLRARSYDDGLPSPVGVGCTAALASDRPKRGSHRVHLAVQTEASTATWSLTLEKGRRSRAEEEQLVGRLLLNVIAEACEVAGRLDLQLLTPEQLGEEHIDKLQTTASPVWQDLLLGKIELLCAGGSEQPPTAVFPGAFNPLHQGHRRMIEIAEEELGTSVALEMSILNVDKPPLDYSCIESRLNQFAAEQPVWLSRAAKFRQKARLFPGATFIVGADTMRRITDPSYYGNNAAACRSAVGEIVRQGCRFLVFGRDWGEGFAGLADMRIPHELARVCHEIPAARFRDDVSSTSIRRAEQ